MQNNYLTSSINQYKLLGGNNSKEQIGVGFVTKKAGTDYEDLYSVDFSIVYVLCGKGNYIDYKGQVYPLTPGSFFMRLPNIKHTNIIEPGSEWHEMFLAFGPQQCKALIDMGFINTEQPVGFIGNQPSLINQAWELLLLMQKVDQNEDHFIYKSISSLLMNMLSLNTQDKKIPQSVVMMEEVSNYITYHLDNRITIDDISRNFGISNTKLRKDFKQFKGISLGNYMIKQRIETSYRYLGDPDISIGEIAELLGYRNSADFSNQFKKLTGHSPSEYRKNLL